MIVTWRLVGTTTAVGLAVIALAAGVFWHSRAPLNRDQLAIHIAALRSQASEAQLIVEAIRNDGLAPKFTRMHVQQMHDAARQISHTLNSKSVIPSLVALGGQTRSLAAQLIDALQLLASDSRAFALGDSPLGSHHEVPFTTLAEQLAVLQSQLKPGG
jgi:hypothetical protein